MLSFIHLDSCVYFLTVPAINLVHKLREFICAHLCLLGGREQVFHQEWEAADAYQPHH